MALRLVSKKFRMWSSDQLLLKYPRNLCSGPSLSVQLAVKVVWVNVTRLNMIATMAVARPLGESGQAPTGAYGTIGAPRAGEMLGMALSKTTSPPAGADDLAGNRLGQVLTHGLTAKETVIPKTTVETDAPVPGQMVEIAAELTTITQTDVINGRTAVATLAGDVADGAMTMRATHLVEVMIMEWLGMDGAISATGTASAEQPEKLTSGAVVVKALVLYQNLGGKAWVAAEELSVAKLGSPTG
ncbi:unnamed protein product, partial [Symbiodinium necroappetens]